MKIKMPKMFKKDNYQLIVAIILLIVVIFITALPWASNTFHEALENISSTPTKSMDGNVKDKVRGKVNDVEDGDEKDDETEDDVRDYTSKMKKMLENGVNLKKEGFVGGVSFRDSPTTFPGSPVDTTKWNNQANTPKDAASPLDKNNMYMFNGANFSPNCCASGPGSGMSTSMGCACLTNSDAFYITQGRGGGNINPTEII
jgi:hypothetical protein